MVVLEQKNGCILLENKRIDDNRGWFSVQINADELSKYGFKRIVQLNHSLTLEKGVIRGFNYQAAPFQQMKIVRCVSGSIYSVGVDIDPRSLNFGKWVGYVLSADNCQLMLLPRTFAHGFITLEENSEMEYFTDEIYSFENAKSIRYDDPDIGVDWTVNGKICPNENILSEKNRCSRNDFRIEKWGWHNDIGLYGNL